MKSGGDTISSGAKTFGDGKGGVCVSSVLALGSMGGIDLYLVVELENGEEEEKERKKKNHGREIYSLGMEEKESGSRVYDIRMRGGTARTGNGEWLPSKKKERAGKKNQVKVENSSRTYLFLLSTDESLGSVAIHLVQPPFFPLLAV